MTGGSGSIHEGAEELARVAVQLLIYSEDPPDVIATKLNLQPTRKTEKGIKRGARTQTRRALGDSANAGTAAKRAAGVLAGALSADHSETRAALKFL